MPIVKTEAVYVDGRPFTKKVKCSSQGEFTCDLPDFVSDDLNIEKHSQPSGRSLSDCLKAWGEKIKEYESITYETTRVICFDFEKEGFFDTGVAISVSADVFEQKQKTDRHGKSTYNYKGVNGSTLPIAMSRKLDPNNRGDYYAKQVPFSDENMKFFSSLGQAMIDLQEKLETLTDTQDAVLEFISSGQRLLDHPA